MWPFPARESGNARSRFSLGAKRRSSITQIVGFSAASARIRCAPTAFAASPWMGSAPSSGESCLASAAIAGTSHDVTIVIIR